MALTTKYPIVEDWRYQVCIPYKTFQENEHEILKWCVEHFGYDEDNNNWVFHFFQGLVYFRFRYERNAMTFKLRWS